ncbi:MAG: adenylate kinase [Erysipelotrichaceae bacterium]|nr:adenylate kinase [Erysipelotrichaceae bacterium]
MHLIIMGAPGSGKGTYAKVLKGIFAVPHISTGEMFRKAISEGTELGKLAQSLIDKGNFVPDEITNELVKQRLSESDCKNGFLLDGYPRNIAQAKAFTEILNELNINLDAVINLNVTDEEIIKRIVNRRLCSKCGAGFNTITMPPKKEGICDLCGSPLYTRADDNEETVKVRLQVYNEQTKPLVQYYDALNKLLDINSNQPIDDAIKDIVKAVEDKCSH